MRVVLDTNVLVSAMLSGAGAPAELLRLILQGEHTLLVDDRILAEYAEVTARPRFGFDAGERGALLDAIAVIAEPVVARPLPGVPLPDPDDRAFLEVAVTGRADALVTGNLRHYPARAVAKLVRVVAPRDVVQR